MLGILIIRWPNPAPAPALISEIWGMCPPRNPSATLQLSICKLRKWLRQITGATVGIRKAAGGYILEPGAAKTDLGEFRRLVKEAEALAGREAFERLARALEFWSGSPLSDVPDHRKNAPYIDVLEAERRQVIRRCAQLAVAVAPDAGVTLARGLCLEDPFDEEAHAILLEALGNTGAHAEALAEFDAIRQRLSTELGIAPGARLLRVQEWILRGRSYAIPPEPCSRMAIALEREQRVLDLASDLESLKERVNEILARLDNLRPVSAES
ncbi:AfsR/SARP family transcriptional regulator [Nonomuraea cavernae]|uniref:AfsR/SARP family transcriptional regulator n=1 Tax=Nonomuraea cavernae TaxID=2045107 RepID=UPI0033DA6CAF